MQIEQDLRLNGVSSSHDAQHGFLSLTYQFRMDDRMSLGAGIGTSWGRYRVAVSGVANTSAGPVNVSDVRWSSVVLYPFERSLGGHHWNTDPWQMWIELRERGLSIGAHSHFAFTCIAGAVPPNAVSVSYGTQARFDSPPGREPFYASTSWGNGWHPLVGLGVDWCIEEPGNDLITLGIEWRGTLNKYYMHRLEAYPLNLPTERILKQAPLFWVAVRVGYALRWEHFRTPKV